MGHEIAEVITLLQILPENRKPSQILKLMQYTSEVKFFKQITEEQQSSKIHISCCQALTCKEFNIDEFIFNHGDEGSFFCIILQGLVKVLIPKIPEIPLAGQGKEREKMSFSLGLGFLKNSIKAALKQVVIKTDDPTNLENLKLRYTPIPEDEKGQELKEESPDHLHSTNIEVTRLGAGASFGELSLLRDAPRAASIQCVEPTIVAILSKIDYKRILGSFQEKQINEKVEFLFGIPAFKKWSRVALMKLSYYFIEKDVRKGAFLYKEGEPPASIYIVKSGEFKVIYT